MQLTKEDLNALLQLLDIATKAGGLNVAGAAVTLAGKIQEILRQQEAETASAPALRAAE